MEKVSIESTTSKYAVKILIDDLDRAQYILSEVGDSISNYFKDLREN